MKARVFTGVGYILVMLILLVLKWLWPTYGSLAFDVLFLLISVIGAYEFLRAAKDISKAQWWTTMATCALTIPAFVIAKALFGMEAGLIAFMGVISIGAMVTATALVYDVDNSTIRSTALCELCILYCGVLGCVGSNVNHLAQNSYVGVILMFALTMCCDSFALLFGLLFGKKLPYKLAPKTSPNKTIIGAFGGVVGGMVGAAITYFICTLLPASPFESSQLMQITSKTHPLVLLIIISVPISIFSQLGDLFESAIKRSFGIKDMGDLLPGHGGVLDRFDSILFASVAVAACLLVINLF